jgi:hypothetical protein
MPRPRLAPAKKALPLAPHPGYNHRRQHLADSVAGRQWNCAGPVECTCMRRQVPERRSSLRRSAFADRRISFHRVSNPAAPVGTHPGRAGSLAALRLYSRRLEAQPRERTLSWNRNPHPAGRIARSVQVTTVRVEAAAVDGMAATAAIARDNLNSSNRAARPGQTGPAKATEIGALTKAIGGPARVPQTVAPTTSAAAEAAGPSRSPGSPS